jgi:CheY-like chemotaxis protein/ketosteroid isomerase-like protein
MSALQTQTAQPMRVLIVEAAPELQETFRLLLGEEGYEPDIVATLEEALVRVQEVTYGLILADLFAGKSPQTLTPAHVLRRRVKPTPIGLLTTEMRSEEEAQAAGFAFVVRMPFDLATFLAQVAAALDRPLCVEQRRQAPIVERWFAALEASDWKALLALCTDDVAYYPPSTSVAWEARRLRGKAALRAYSQRAAAYYTHNVFTDVLIYAQPHGLIARHTSHWITPDERRHRAAGATLFHFRGMKICQVGVRADLARTERAGAELVSIHAG